MFGTERGVFLHDGLILTSTPILNDTASSLALLATGLIEELDHLLKVLGTVHAHTVAAFRYKGCLGLDTSGLQCLIELLTLTARNHVIFLAVEDDDWRTVLIDIAGSTQAEILIGILGEL